MKSKGCVFEKKKNKRTCLETIMETHYLDHTPDQILDRILELKSM